MNKKKNRYKRGILKFCRTYYPIQNKLEIIVRDASKLFGAGVERVQKKDGKTTAEILAGGPLQLSHELFHVFERLYREDLGLEPIQPRTPQSEFFALFGELSYAQKRQENAGGIEPLKFEFRSNELLYMAAKSILISPQEEIDLAAIYLLQQLNEQKRKEVFMKCHEIPGLNQNPELLLKTITPYLPKKH